MARSLFDASRMAGPPNPAKGDGGDDAWTVSRLTRRIEEALETGLPKRVRVVGEVSSPNNRTHWYFNLKDEGAVVSCVLFASDARRSSAVPEHGGRFIATGRVQHYAKQGRTQLYVERLEAVGAGALEARLRALIDELRSEGYFDEAHKSPLPTFPGRIAVITSRTGAALQDVLDTMRRRCPGVGVLLVDARVQGEGAGERIARLVDALDARADGLGLDAILITRGGGSLEDLWCFNDRALADAIWDCELPVVCAVGHETDTTVCELVADRRCATPTQAAMVLTPDTHALSEQLDMAARRLVGAAVRTGAAARRRAHAAGLRFTQLDPTDPPRERLQSGALAISKSARSALTQRHLRLERLAARLATCRPESAHRERLHAVDRAERRLRRAVGARLTRADLPRAETRLARAARREIEDQRRVVDTLERELVLVSPASVLSRGYSLTTLAETGALARTPANARAGDALITRLAGGTLRSRVEGEGEGGRAAPVQKLPPRRRRRKRDDPDQMGLF